MALKELKKNSVLNLKKADKVTTVIMNNHNLSKHRQWKTCRKGLTRSLTKCVRANIDDMTKRWLSKTPNPPRIPIFYKLTKIHVHIPVGRSIISGCNGPTERISSFMKTLPQPMAQWQQSYMKDATVFYQLKKKTKVGKDTILVSTNVSSLYTNITQEEGKKHTKSSTTITYRSQRTTSGKCLA